jgi:hypothetical protein
MLSSGAEETEKRQEEMEQTFFVRGFLREREIGGPLKVHFFLLDAVSLLRESQ